MFLRTDVYLRTRKDPTLFYGLKDEAYSVDNFYGMLQDSLNHLARASVTSTNIGTQLHDFVHKEFSDESLVNLIAPLDSEKLTDSLFGWLERLKKIKSSEQRDKDASTLIELIKNRINE